MHRVPTLTIAQNPAADELLGRDPLALLLGMLLDQQFPMERAFAAPRLLADRLGVGTLSAADLAAADPEALTKAFQGPPALHRYPGSMAGRTQELCRLLVARHGRRAGGRPQLPTARRAPGARSPTSPGPGPWPRSGRSSRRRSTPRRPPAQGSDEPPRRGQKGRRGHLRRARSGGTMGRVAARAG